MTRRHAPRWNRFGTLRGFGRRLSVASAKLRCGMHESLMNRKLVPHHSHWGAFNAIVEDGKVVGAVPFDFDPDPSPLIEAIPDAVQSPLRIARPVVRAGWLKDGRASGKGRGREPFLPVDWEQALELVARQLWRVRCGHGPSA